MKIKSFFNSILLIAIIIFAGFVFWLGWIQYELEENSYGVVYTNTSGWKEKLYSPGKFNWSIEKVIPENFTIHKFTILSKPLNFNINDDLPSGELYAIYNQIDPDNFSYSYKFTGSIKFDFNFLLSKTKQGEFDESNFQEWEDNKITEIQNTLKSFIREKINNSETLTINGSTQEYIKEKYPYFLFTDFNININMPDMILYTSSRNRYLQNIKIETKAEESYLIKALEKKNQDKLKLELLKEYGKVFTEYPIMIEYLKIDQGILDRASINDFISSENQK